MYAYVGLSNNMNDSRVFRQSKFHKFVMQGGLLNVGRITLDGHKPLILADTFNSCRQWLSISTLAYDSF